MTEICGSGAKGGFEGPESPEGRGDILNHTYDVGVKILAGKFVDHFFVVNNFRGLGLSVVIRLVAYFWCSFCLFSTSAFFLSNFNLQNASIKGFFKFQYHKTTR